jgi:hypothetical protein
MLPGVGGSGFFSFLGGNGFDGESSSAFAAAPPRPTASLETRQQAPQRRGLDGWLIDQFFSRR